MDDFEARRKMNDLKKQVNKKTPPPSPPKQTRSPFQRFLRGVLMMLLIGGYLVAGVGGFVLGRLSIYPHVSTHLPTTTATLPPDTATPEEVVQGYYDAIKHRNLDQALTLFHSDRRGTSAVHTTQNLIERYPLLSKIDILTSQEKSTATVMVSYTMKSGYTSRQGFELRKEAGAWRIYDM